MSIKCLYWLCFYSLLFGADSIFLAKPYPIHTAGDLAFLVYAQRAPAAAYYFIIPALILCIFLLFNTRIYFIADLVIWFLVVNLHNKLYSSLTGGDYLLNQFLLFNSVLSLNYERKKTWQTEMKITLHNLGIVAIIGQVCLVYVLSGILKLNNAEWLSGKAIGVISQIRHYSLFSFPAPINFPHAFSVILNYVVLFYQLFFPLLVWLKPVKKPLLILGILMHLYIALVMGLVGFGLVMILPYFFFWPFKRMLSV